jgi:hypothetical protein
LAFADTHYSYLVLRNELKKAAQRLKSSEQFKGGRKVRQLKSVLSPIEQMIVEAYAADRSTQ